MKEMAVVCGDAILHPFGLIGGWAIFVGRKDRSFHIVVEGNKRFYENLLGIYCLFDVGQNPSPTVMGLASMFVVELLDFSVDLDNSVINVNHVRYDQNSPPEWKFEVKGEIHKITKVRKTFSPRHQTQRTNKYR